MRHLLDALGVVTRSEAEEVCELLLGRMRAVDAGLQAAERLYDAGERLLEELDIELHRTLSGQSTVRETEEGYEEFWRGRARAFGLDVALSSEEASERGATGQDATGENPTETTD